MSKGKSPLKLGARLKKVRKELGLSQRDMGKALRLSDKAVSSYEVGRAIPSIDTLRHISEITYRPLSYFLEEGDSNRFELRSKLDMIENELSEIRKLLQKEEKKK